MSRTIRNKLSVYKSKTGAPKMEYKCRCEYCLNGKLHKHTRKIQAMTNELKEI